MKSLQRIIVVCLCALLLTSAYAAVPSLQSFGYWDAVAHQPGRGPSCFAASYAQGRAPGTQNSRMSFATVSTTGISITLGYHQKNGTRTWLDIDGHEFKLVGYADLAGMNNTIDSAETKAVSDALQVGKSMVVHGTKDDGEQVADFYSLSGFAKAHEAISAACTAQ